MSGFPRQLRFSLLRSREIKTRKKRDHGESPAALFTRRNKFSALPKSHNFDFEKSDGQGHPAPEFPKLADFLDFWIANLTDRLIACGSPRHAQHQHQRQLSAIK